MCVYTDLFIFVYFFVLFLTRDRWRDCLFYRGMRAHRYVNNSSPPFSTFSLWLDSERVLSYGNPWPRSYVNTILFRPGQECFDSPNQETFILVSVRFYLEPIQMELVTAQLPFLGFKKKSICSIIIQLLRYWWPWTGRPIPARISSNSRAALGTRNTWSRRIDPASALSKSCPTNCKLSWKVQCLDALYNMKSNHHSPRLILDLLEEDARPADNGSTVKAKLFYRSCMNTSEYKVILWYASPSPRNAP